MTSIVFPIHIYIYVLHSGRAVLTQMVSALISVRAFFKCAPRQKLSQVGSPLCACLHSSRLSLRGGRMLNPKCATEGCQPEASAAWRPLCAVAVPVEKYNRMCVHCERKERRSAKENERRDEIIVVKICVIKTTYRDKWANDKLQGYASVDELLEIANYSINFKG